MAAGFNMYGNPENSLFTDVGQASAVAGASALGWASIGLGAAGLGLSLISGAMGASAARKAARAKMSALKQEKAWNLGVMRRNKEDVYASNILSSYASGINPMTGSNAAVILGNQQVLQDEINFQESQYNAELKNLKAQSKQKYLGLF